MYGRRCSIIAFYNQVSWSITNCLLLLNVASQISHKSPNQQSIWQPFTKIISSFYYSILFNEKNDHNCLTHINQILLVILKLTDDYHNESVTDQMKRTRSKYLARISTEHDPIEALRLATEHIVHDLFPCIKQFNDIWCNTWSINWLSCSKLDFFQLADETLISTYGLEFPHEAVIESE